MLASRDARGFDRELHEARIYTGRPDTAKDPKSYAAHMKQCARWTADGCRVFHRPLRYPLGYPRLPAQEKDVDVQLSIDVVAGAIDGDYDIGIVLSTDSDLRPAIELVANRFVGIPRIEIAGGSNGTHYSKQHPTIADSAVNYDNMVIPDNSKSGFKSDFTEPDCSPHPFDVMAVFALYQTRFTTS